MQNFENEYKPFFLLEMWLYFFDCNTFYHCDVRRIIISRFLPALSWGVLGELWPHTEDSADWVQRPQADTDTQGEDQSSFLLSAIKENNSFR